MKKIYTLLSLLLLISSSGIAQQLEQQFEHYTARVVSAEQASTHLLKALGCVDTLNDYVNRANNSFVLQGASGGGYVFGTSNDGSGGSITTATALHFDDIGMITVDEVFAWVGNKQIIGGADLIKMELYTAGLDSMPNTLVGFTNANMAFVDTATGGVNFTTMARLARFSFSVGGNQLSGDFCVSLNYDSVDDTLALVSTANGAGFGENRVKQYLGPNLGGGWFNASAIWTGLDADVVMIPITTCIVSNDSPAFENEHFRVFPAYPNPSTDEVHLDIELPKATELQVMLWDVTGRVLYDSGKNQVNAGAHSFDLDVSDLAAGSYYYTVKTSESMVNSKVQVVK